MFSSNADILNCKNVTAIDDYSFNAKKRSQERPRQFIYFHSTAEPKQNLCLHQHLFLTNRILRWFGINLDLTATFTKLPFLAVTLRSLINRQRLDFFGGRIVQWIVFSLLTKRPRVRFSVSALRFIDSAVA